MSEKRSLRLLAAIMFADIEGYTRMMQDDEQKAKDLRDRQRKVLEDSIKRNHGQVMQYYGDGTLSMFGSALDAAQCAKEIQVELQEEPKVPVRIGIHLGDVVYDEEGIYGDAVNVASRVQALGVSGGVMISGKVFDEIKNHPGLRVEAFGEHELKNVYKPVSIYALADDGLAVPDQDYIHNLTGSGAKSIAVLPFVNFSSDPEQEYFSDGVTEEIINALVRLRNLHVSARTSVFAFKNTNKDIRDISRELNVEYILEGSVRKAGPKVRVTSQLIKAKDGYHLWSETYDGDMTDIFDFQDNISQKIAEKLSAEFQLNDDGSLYEASTDSVNAYNEFLKGLFYYNKRTPEAVFKSIRHFEQAIYYCSTYTNAFSYIANCYTYLGALGEMKGEEAFSKAAEYARQAITQGNHRAASYVAYGYVKLLFEWDFDLADSNFRKAITMEPNDGVARQAYAFYYMIIGNFEQMLVQAKMSLQIEPVSLQARLICARAYWLNGMCEKAMEMLQESLEMDPGYRSAIQEQIYIHIDRGQYEEARVKSLDFIEKAAKPHTGIAIATYLFYKTGDTEKAAEYEKKLISLGENNEELNLTVDEAIIAIGKGEHDDAFEKLNKAADEKLGLILLLNYIPIFRELRDDDRYSDLLKKIGLPMNKIISSEKNY